MNAEYTGKKIAELRKAKDLTQKQLAQKLHITDKAVSKWERGANFPDLGLMEELAKELDTTPALLLGIENASKEEVVTSMTELSTQQAEQSNKDIQLIAWLELFIAIPILVALHFLSISMIPYGKYSEFLTPFHFIRFLVVALAILAIYTLRKYGGIRQMEFTDMMSLYIMGFSIAIFFGIQLYTGGTVHYSVSAILCIIIIGCVQLFFYRMMIPPEIKALPVIASILWGGVGFWTYTPYLYGGVTPDFVIINYLLPFLVSLVVWTFCFLREKTKNPPRLSYVLMTLAILAFIAFFFFQDFWVQSYVKASREKLETYAEELLEATRTNTDYYGIWKVNAYRGSNMVEFHTGGSGLVPNASYRGFYYSPDNTHKAYQGVEENVEFTYLRSPNKATWTDGTDNEGISIRIIENWFWFEAHF